MSEGKWIKEKLICPYIGYRCSNCRNFVVINKVSPFEDISEYKYCFNCGAKMEVEK